MAVPWAGAIKRVKGNQKSDGVVSIRVQTVFHHLPGNRDQPMSNPFLRVLLLSTAFASLAACGGGPSEPDPNDFSNVGREILEDPSFNTHILDIFAREGCSSGACHGPGESAGLNLEREFAYSSLVGIASTQEGFERVTAGKSSESYLVIKLEGRQQVGTRMPPTGSALDAIDIGNIKNWIDKGAKNN